MSYFECSVCQLVQSVEEAPSVCPRCETLPAAFLHVEDEEQLEPIIAGDGPPFEPRLYQTDIHPFARSL